MSIVRVIPILLLKDEGLVKTKKFKDPVYIGDPINAVRIFNEKEVDELLLLDIDAAKKIREPQYQWLKDIVSESFMPIGYGGGIDSVDKAKKVFDLGIEKVILNSASFNYELVEQLASIYGSQSIVISIDVKKSIFGIYNTYSESSKQKHSIDPVQHAKKVVNAGAGEIIIQSIDNEGTMKGYDIELIKSVCESVPIPVVASGGAGSIEDLEIALKEGNASAVSAGSLFVYKGKQNGILINYPTEIIQNKFFENVRRI
jgi:imidazole glycerol-phosphate synthase subunit HisF